MRAVVQRVKRASVLVEGQTVGAIEEGLLVLLAIHKRDEEEQCGWLADKVANLRIFRDAAGKMNLSLKEIGASALVVSQFTLYANCQRGRRPDFLESAPPESAEPLYELFAQKLAEQISRVERGRFGAHMEVELVNNGPVTMLIDTPIKNSVQSKEGAI